MDCLSRLNDALVRATSEEKASLATDAFIAIEGIQFEVVSDERTSSIVRKFVEFLNVDQIVSLMSHLVPKKKLTTLFYQRTSSDFLETCCNSIMKQLGLTGKSFMQVSGLLDVVEKLTNGVCADMSEIIVNFYSVHLVRSIICLVSETPMTPKAPVAHKKGISSLGLSFSEKF